MKNNNSALLVMDMQMGIITTLPNLPDLLGNILKVISTAHEKKIPIIYVTVSFRPGTPEVSSDNKFFNAARPRFASAGFSDLHPEILPVEGDLFIQKKRFSAFTGSDLEVLLKGLGVNSIVLAGVSTGGVVLSTIREAADKDYQITVLSDGCADPDEEVHRVLMNKVFPRQAEVTTSDQWCL